MNNNQENESPVDTEICHVTKAGANIFLEFGFPEDEAIELHLESNRRIKKSQLRDQLITYLNDYIKNSKLTHTQIAEVLKISRPKVSNLVTKRVSIDYSIDELITLIYRLPNEPTVQICIVSIDKAIIGEDKTT